MTYDTSRIEDARQPVGAVELYLDTCAYDYGQSVTNLLTYSEQFDHADWVKFNAPTITANTDIAPNGAITSDTIEDDSAASEAIYQNYVSLDVTKTYTISIYVKKDSIGRATRFPVLRIRFSGSTTETSDLKFDTKTGEYDGDNVVIEGVGDYWRISISAKSTDTLNDTLLVYFYPALGASLIWLTDALATGSCVIWGAQLVEGSKAGHYVKTEATSLTGACTATSGAGGECYNTFATCQDTPNYTKTLKTYRLYQPVSNWPIGQAGYPAIKGQPTFTPTQIDPKGSLGKRGIVTIKLEDFADDDLFTDEYASTRTYNPETQGTFFRKLKARTPYYKGRLMKVRQGYINDPFSFNDFEDRLYVIDSIKVDSKGVVSIVGKDILKLAEDKRSVIPEASAGTLSTAYTAGGTTLVLQTGEGVDYTNDPYTGSAISASIIGYARVGDNVLKYTGVSTDTLTGVVGGQWGTTDEDLDIDDGLQQCLSFDAVNVVDILHYLLNTGASIDETYLPYDAGLTTPTGTNNEWDEEKDTWLSGNDLTYIVTAPSGINKLVANICKQNLLYMWFDERSQEIKLKAIAPSFRRGAPESLTDNEHIITESLSTKDNDNGRISQIWVYYDIVNITDDLNKPENYKKLNIQVDADSENINAYNEKSIKVIYADWLSSSNAGLIITLGGRLLSRYAGTPSITNFKLDAKDASVWTGSLAILDSFNFQMADGSNDLQKIQVLSVKDDHDKQIIEITAESWDFSDNRYGYVTPDSMGDYTAETAENQKIYGFISQNDGKYTNGDIGHLIA